MPSSSYGPGSAALKDLKLNALLEVTKAINENLSTEKLLTLYEYILKDQLGVDRLVLFNNYEGWQRSLKFGVKGQLREVDVEEDLLQYKEITHIESSIKEVLSQFDIVIPVFHKHHPLAFVLVGGITGSDPGRNGELEYLNFIQTLTNLITVAIENKRLAKESLRQERFKKELELASEMQTAMIPTQLPRNEHVEMAGYYQPHQQVGGDYYDVVRLNEEEFIFCMGDVSGKGVTAALLMSNFQANVRTLLNYTDLSLEELLHELNYKVNESAEGERFITFFIGRYDLQEQELEYINAGHDPPLLCYQGETRWLETGSPGLGMLDQLPFVKKGREKLAPGTIVVCYTDGVVELENEEGENFRSERFETIVRDHEQEVSMEALNRSILDDLGTYGDRDDTALFSFRVL